MEIFRLFGSVFVDNDAANKAIDETDKKGQSLGGRLGELGEKATGLGSKMSGMITAPVIGGFLALTQGTKDLRTDMGKLETAFTTAGFTAQQAKDVYVEFYGILGESDTAIEAVNHLSKMTTTQQELADWTTIATGVFATFGDSLPIEGLTEAANETAKVGQVTGPLADALNWAGVSEDDFNESLGKCSTEQERQALITETLTGLYGDAAAKYREVNAELIEANKANARLGDSMQILGATLEPILTPIIAKITEMVSKFNELSPTAQKAVLAVVGIAAAVGPLLIVFGAVAGAVSSIIGLFGAGGLAAVFTALTGPIGLVVLAIGALIAIGVLLYKNWDEIKAFASEMWNNLKTGWTEGTESLGIAWTGLKTQVSDTWNTLWDGVTTKFRDIKLSLTEMTNEIVGWVITKFGTFKTDMLEVWKGIVGGIKGYANGIIGMVNGIINALNTIQVEIPDWVPGVGGSEFGVNIPNVPYLAEGGDITRRGWAIVGEAGPELLNLNAGAQVKPLAAAPTIGEINIYGNDADEVWAKFERELGRRGVRLG